MPGSKKTQIDILYEDKDIIAVFKRSGLLTIATDDGNLNNLYHYVREYANRKRQRVFVVHRLDRDTSGIVIFAKSIEMKKILQSAFEDRKVYRKYEAVVREDVELGTKNKVVQYLLRDERSGKTYATKNRKLGKEAITIYEAKKKIKDGTVLDIEIKTGRQNQIRLALLSEKMTLIGDSKYAMDVAPRMMLNEYEISFPNEIRMKERHFRMKPLWLD